MLRGECEANARGFERGMNGRLCGEPMPYVLFISVDYEKVHKKIGKKSGSSSNFYNKRKSGSVKMRHRGYCAPVS